LVDLVRRPCNTYGFLLTGGSKNTKAMFFKIILFLNLLSLGLALYILIKHLKDRKKDENMKKQDDAI
jgi:hypothetical protein